MIFFSCSHSFEPTVPDFKPSVIADYLSKFSPSFIVGFVQHLTDLLYNRLLQQADLRGPVQRIRHGSKDREKLIINVFSSIKVSLLQRQPEKSLLPGRNGKIRHTYCTVLVLVSPRLCQRLFMHQD